MSEELFAMVLTRIMFYGRIEFSYNASTKIYSIYDYFTKEYIFQGSKEQLKEWLLK